MPSVAEHIKKADANALFAKGLSLVSPAEIDWALIALFYAAVHYIEAYLAKNNQHLRSHTTRDRTIVRDAHLRAVYNEYSHLKFYGYNARYEMTAFNATDVTVEAIPALAKLRQHVIG